MLATASMKAAFKGYEVGMHLPSLRFNATNPRRSYLESLSDRGRSHKLVFLFVTDRQYTGEPVREHGGVIWWQTMNVEDSLLQPVRAPGLHPSDEVLTDCQ